MSAHTFKELYCALETHGGLVHTFKELYCALETHGGLIAETELLTMLRRTACVLRYLKLKDSSISDFHALLPESKHEAIGISDTEAAQELTQRGLSLEQSVIFCRWVALQLAHFGRVQILIGPMTHILISRPHSPLRGWKYTLMRLLVEEAQAIAQQRKPDHIVHNTCDWKPMLRDPAMHDIPPMLWNGLISNGVLDPVTSSPSKTVFPGSVYSLLGFKPPHQSTDAEAPTPNLPTPLGKKIYDRSLAGWTRLREEPAGAQSIEGFCVDIAVLETKQAAGIPLCPHDYDLQRELRLAKNAITEALAEETQRYRQTVEVEANQSARKGQYAVSLQTRVSSPSYCV
jgi:hypothetical protein